MTERRDADRTDAASLPAAYKVRGKFERIDGAAVFGYNTAVSGATEGVRGRVDTFGDGGAGVFGEATGIEGKNYGVKGTTASGANGAAGVYGEASSPGGDGAGVVAVGKGTGFTSLGTRFPAAGVRATATNSTGTTAGVHGINRSFADGNAGLEGEATKTSGRTYGVRGRIASGETGAAGVYGESADSGETYGLKGVANSPDGYGIYTPDDAKLEGDLATTANHTVRVDGSLLLQYRSGEVALNGDLNTAPEHRFLVDDDRILRLGSTGTDTDSSGITYTIGGAVVGGYEGNAVNGALGATIAGGGGAKAKIIDGSSSVLDSAPNEVTDRYGTVGGGAANRAGDARSGTTNAMYATVGGGLYNVAGGDRSGTTTGIWATVGGGAFNVADGNGATVGGGVNNAATDVDATVGGGDQNTASSSDATVSGGQGNTASGVNATVGGGADNRAGKSGTSKGVSATVPGGELNHAREDYSFAAGRKAKARAEGAFVWGDGSSNAVESTTEDEVVFQAGGGMQVWSSSDFSSAVSLPSGANSWQNGSSRTIKTDVTPVDPRSILAGVEDLTVSRWEYESQPGVDHLGPMAEEFYDAFGLGADDEHISSVDADGVAFAAIQGLAERLDDAREELKVKDDRIDHLEAENERKTDQIDRLAAENDRKTERIDHLEAENERKTERIDRLEDETERLRDRLAALESRVATGETGVTGDD